MANRNWANGGKLYAMHVSMVMVNTTVTIGAAGAVSAFSGPLVASVTHVSTGIYRVNMQNNFNQLIHSSNSMRSPSSGLTGVSTIEVQNAPNTNVSSLTAPSLTVKTLDAAGALVDPASGSTIDVMAIMSNSSVNVQSSPVATE